MIGFTRSLACYLKYMAQQDRNETAKPKDIRA